MKNIGDNFKIDIRTYGRQLDFKIKINNIIDDIDNYSYLKPAFHANLFKTVMHELEIDTKNILSPKAKVNIEAGIKLNEPTYNYIKYNTYIVKNCDRQEDTNSYIVKAYDKMIEAMIDYDLELVEKITLKEYLIKICERLGWNINNIPATFINSDKLIDPTLHQGIKYTFRDALDEIATISCSFLLFIEDEFHLIYPTETNETIDASYLDEDSVTIGERYFINSLVFSRAEESDNIFRKDDVSITENGLHEYRISDNQLLSTNERDLYIDNMFDYLKSFEFYPFDIKTKGILFLEACDGFEIFLSGKRYLTILLNDETVFEDGLTEDIYTEVPEETESDYKCADSTDKRINQTYIIVDKQNKKIEELTSQTTEYEKKLTQTIQDVDGIKQQVSNTIEFKRQIDGVTQIYLKDAKATEILKLEIQGKTSFEDKIYQIAVDKHSRTNPSEEKQIYEVNTTLFANENTYDSLVITRDETYVIRRLGFNEQSELVELAIPIKVALDPINIQLFEGDNYIYLENMIGNKLYAEYLIKNDFTDTYATVVQMNSAINQTAEEINSVVSKKIGEDEVCTIISQSADKIRIEGNRLEIETQKYKLVEKI